MENVKKINIDNKKFVIERFKTIGFIQFAYWLAKLIAGKDKNILRNILALANVSNDSVDMNFLKTIQSDFESLISDFIFNIFEKVEPEDIPKVLDNLLDTVYIEKNNYQEPLLDNLDNLSPLTILKLIKINIKFQFEYIFAEKKRE
ncbi:hypothetical protein [Francisella tularensis]|uniref:hypothetical protein n=1 Tax=Francisella tularensis TaxID=263 RepID=UPI0008F4A85E|nr:hypothetical protein [Francisella tularensis]APA83234.1 hypothetical protein N894_1250 [Francisella tularensis subsp. novicida PA10-7858]